MKNNYCTQASTLLIFLFTLISPNIATAQEFEWIRSQPINYSYNPDMPNYTVATDEYGDVIYAGMDNFNLNYAGMYGDLFLKKFIANGDEILVKQIIGSGLVDHLAAKNGKYYLSGEFKDSLYFPGQAGLYTMGNSSEFFFAICDDQGNAELVYNLSEKFPGINDISQFIIDDEDMIFFGISIGNSSKIIKMDATGNVAQTIEQTNVWLINNIDFDPDGNIIVAGGFADTQSYFGGELFEVSTQDNMYVAKYNPRGQAQWVKFVVDVLYTSQNQIKCDHTGNIYFAGSLFTDVQFGPFQAHGPDWVFDFFLTKLNADGEFQWLVEVPENSSLGDASIGKLHFLEVDANSNVYVSGFIRGSIDWGNGVVSTGDNYYDLLLLNFSPDGIIQWSKSGGSPSFVKSIDLAIDASGNCYMAGIGGGEMVFDTITHFQEGFEYPFIAKLSNDIFTGVSPTISYVSDFEVYPNPANGFVNISLSKETNEAFTVNLLTATGQKLYSGYYQSAAKNIYLELPYTKGLFMIELQFEDGMVLRKKMLANQ